MLRNILLICSLFLLNNIATASDLIIGSTTSTKGSGLFDLLIPKFEKETGIKTKVFSVGTGTALRMARQGKVDVLLVHAPSAETKLIADGYGISRVPIMKNDFIVVGPKSDPAKIHKFEDVNLAFKNIHLSQSQFISRADDSGTHKKEVAIWKACKISPSGDWYYEVGASMKMSLNTANSQSAYILVDRGTWLANRKSLNLIIHVEGDRLLENPYHAIAVNPKKHKHVNISAANKFINWLTSSQGHNIINQLKIDNEQLFKVTVK